LSITKSEWNDWKQDNITRAFFQATMERIEDTKEILSTSAGLDQMSDNFYRGFLAAYREMLDFKVDDIDEDDKDD